ncbi:hypothetical protein QJS04_geneDACA023017 [Acorus gramineus]|uniref:Uncharacterized protein n=1 Tax=Acorus gramineus TaxID=55184 RepID=A0AAV9BUN9_ACOGR|nr:hypothetical protein QJS04_geneDACA023017 [Acorus gramineus]
MEGCMRSRSRPSFYAPSADESRGQGIRAPKGYVPVVVGRGREQETVFMVHTKLFNHPSFVAMLERASEEVGYEHQGMIRVPFDVQQFRMTVRIIIATMAIHNYIRRENHADNLFRGFENMNTDEDRTTEKLYAQVQPERSIRNE